MPKMLVLQPQYFERFRCIGADCEDTCCDGWGVIVDRATFEKYQDPTIAQVGGEALSGLVELNPASISSSDYAKMRLVGTRCCALREGLCSIQQDLGESHISDMCSSFPRVLNLTNGVLERALHLSCPEAARLALSDANALVFREHTELGSPDRPGSLHVVEGKQDDQMLQVRNVLIRVIKDRSRPLCQRIGFLGLAIEAVARNPEKPALTILEENLTNLRSGLFDEILSGQIIAPAVQIEIVVELIVTRFGIEYTSPRFLECYAEFMRGLNWTNESTMAELTQRYQQASRQYLQPFLEQHEYLFENYLVNYMFRTLFPYGRRQPDLKWSVDSEGESLRNAYLLLTAHYAIIRTVLIGMAALHQDSLCIDHVVRLVQSCTKAFQHSNSFSAVILQFLAQHAEDPMRDVAVLVMD